jgi:hypothetical protein
MRIGTKKFSIYIRTEYWDVEEEEWINVKLRFMEMIRNWLNWDDKGVYEDIEAIGIGDNLDALTRWENWQCKVRPLGRDMYEYIDWRFYDFETTKIRSNILEIAMKNVEDWWEVEKERWIDYL